MPPRVGGCERTSWECKTDLADRVVSDWAELCRTTNAEVGHIYNKSIDAREIAVGVKMVTGGLRKLEEGAAETTIILDST